MKSRRNRPFAMALVILLVATTPALAAKKKAASERIAGPGRVGQPIVHPSEFVPMEQDQLLLLGEPELTVHEAVEPRDPWPKYGSDKHRQEVREDSYQKYEVTLGFGTAVPCPAAKVYYGIFEPDQKKVIAPRYRFMEEEEIAGLATEHAVTIDLALLMIPKLDPAGASDGTIVAYRIELYDARRAGTVFYEGRFEFAMHGKQHVRVPTIVEGPFVDLVTPESAVISFRTDKPVPCVVKIDGRTVGDDTPRRVFEIPVAGLEPDTAYPYRIEITSRGHDPVKGPWTLHTAPAQPRAFTFAVMGDSREGVGGGERAFGGLNHRTLSRFFADAVNRGAEFIVHSGDLVNGYTTSNLDFFMQLEAFKDTAETVGHSVPIYEVMGNHEVIVDQFDDRKSYFGIQFDKQGESSAEAFFARAFVNPKNGPDAEPHGPTYDENAYTFDYANCRFVVMNNNYWYSSHAEEYGGNLEGYVLDGQTEWLKKKFAEAAGDDSIDHIFLFAQEAMFPNGGHVKDGMWYSGGDSMTGDGKPADRRYVVARRDEIWEAFAATGKAAAANFGDEHAYNRTLIHEFEYEVFGEKKKTRFAEPVWQIISGGAGAPFYSQEKDVPWAGGVKVYSTQMNYTVFHVDGAKVVLEAYTFNGELLDRALLRQ